MRVIATVGLPGSGKGEAAAVARDCDIPVVTMGDIVREATRERGLDPGTDHGRVASQLREEDGPAAIAERALPAIREHLDGSDTVLVDGVRSDAAVDRFEAAFGDDFTLVSIEAPFEVRAERIDRRGRDDPAAETLRERDERELGFGTGAAMDRADVTVENTDSLEAFRDRICDLLGADD